MSYYDTALNSTENIALSNFLQPILAENTFFIFFQMAGAVVTTSIV